MDRDSGRSGGSGGHSIGPLQFGPGYSPWRDPTVVTLLVISLVALLLFVGGATFGPGLSDDDGDGVFPVIDILTSDDGGDDEPALSLDANRTELEVGDAVAFTVTGENGTPATDATLTVDDDSHAVDEEGRAIVRIDQSGSVTARARAPGANDTIVESDDVALTVTPRTTDLAIRANRSTATAGEPIELTLVRADSDAPVQGSIAATVVADDDGTGIPTAVQTVQRSGVERLVVTPDRSGRLFLRGERSEQDGERFEPYSGTIEIDRQPVALNLTVEPDETTAGESIAATVRRTDTGEPVDATVAIEHADEERTVATGPDGATDVTLDAAGAWTIEASAASTPAIRFTPDEASVDVERRQVALDVAVDRSSITTGGRVGVAVARADTGEPIEASVEIAGETYATGEDGTVDAVVDAPGEHAIVATAPNTSVERFTAAEATLTVADATIELDSLDAPASAAPGETVTVATTATNQGPDGGADTFELVLDGEVVDRAVLEIAAGEEARVELDAAVPEESGRYKVAIRGSDDAVGGTVNVES